MNERIEELWNKASFDTDSWEAQTRFIEKFAELIVKECARVARSTPCPYFDEHMKQQLGHT